MSDKMFSSGNWTILVVCIGLVSIGVLIGNLWSVLESVFSWQGIQTLASLFAVAIALLAYRAWRKPIIYQDLRRIIESFGEAAAELNSIHSRCEHFCNLLDTIDDGKIHSEIKRAKTKIAEVISKLVRDASVATGNMFLTIKEEDVLKIDSYVQEKFNKIFEKYIAIVHSEKVNDKEDLIFIRDFAMEFRLNCVGAMKKISKEKLREK